MPDTAATWAQEIMTHPCSPSRRGYLCQRQFCEKVHYSFFFCPRRCPVFLLCKRIPNPYFFFFFFAWASFFFSSQTQAISHPYSLTKCSCKIDSGYSIKGQGNYKNNLATHKKHPLLCSKNRTKGFISEWRKRVVVAIGMWTYADFRG